MKSLHAEKPTQMRVVSAQRLEYHENKPRFPQQSRLAAASERIASCSRGSSDMQWEQICHCQSAPAFCFPSLPLLRVCLLSPCVRRALRKLWVTARPLPLEPSCITACNLRYGLLDYTVLCCCCPLLSALFSVSVYRLTCWIRCRFLTQQENC